MKEIERLSLILTPLVLGSCVLVLCLFGRKLRSYRGRKMLPEELLITGICVGFLGKLLDNSYWAIPWAAKYFGVEHFYSFFDFGVAMNVPFRQLSCIVSAGFHLLAAHRMAETRIKLAFKWAVIYALLYFTFVAWLLSK